MKKPVPLFLLKAWFPFFLLSCFFPQAAIGNPVDCGNAAISSEECRCLVSLYYSFNGPDWLDQAGNQWISGDDPGEWSGVEVENGHVVAIHRSGMNLTGEIPDLTCLPYLLHLDLSNNHLTGDFDIGNLPNSLVSLDLSQNHLTGGFPDLSNHPDIQFLNIGFNRLEGEVRQFQPPSGLYYLSIAGNRFSGEIPVIFNGTAILDPSYNMLKTLPAASVPAAGYRQDWEITQTIPPSGVSVISPEPKSVIISWTSIPYTGDGGYYQVRYGKDFTGSMDIIAGKTKDKLEDNLKITGLSPGKYVFVVETFTPAHETPVGFQQNDLLSEPGTPISITVPDWPPQITGQKVIETAEEVEREILLSDLVVSDPDSPWPDAFQLFAGDGQFYQRTGNVITPAPDFNGTLHVPVTVSDGISQSAPFDLVVNVLPVNDRPVISGQKELSTIEDTPISINIPDLVIADPDNRFPEDFSIFIENGEHYWHESNTIYPETDYNGSLFVPVTVSDGASTSDPFFLSIEVLSENDTPVITGQKPLRTDEDCSLTIHLSDIEVVDPDNTFPDGFTLTVYRPGGEPYPDATVVPPKDFFGIFEAGVTVSDGVSQSPVFYLTIQVDPVNDPPVIFGQEELVTPEDTPVTLSPADFMIIDPDNSPVEDFSLVIGSGDHYSVSGSRIVPEKDYNGTLSIPVQISDDMYTSAPFQTLLTVTPVNDPPSFTSNPRVDAMQSQEYRFTVTAGDPDDDDILTMEATILPEWLGFTDNGNGTALLAGKPSHMDVGTHSVALQVTDRETAGDTLSFSITVAHLNDRPVIVGQQELSTPEETAIEIVPEYLVVSEPDNLYPEGYTIHVLEGVHYSLNGIEVKPDEDFNGKLIVPVTVNDGTVDSNLFNLEINVIPVNDAPYFKSAPITRAARDLSYRYGITCADKDPNDEIEIFPGRLPKWLHFQDLGNGKAELTGIPSIQNDGLHSVSIFARDLSGETAAQSFTIIVGDFGTDPVITGQMEIDTPEETPFTIQTSHLRVSDSDNTYPDGYGIHVRIGKDYSVDGRTITPDRDFTGTLTVPVSVFRGTLESDVFNLEIEVTDINDAPAFVSAAVTTAQTGVLYRYDISVSDPDLGSVPEMNAPVLPGWLMFLDNGDGTALLSGIPPQGEETMFDVEIQARDKDGASSIQKFVIRVTDINDPPVIVDQMPVVTYSETPVTIELEDLVVTDPDNVYPDDFSLFMGNGEDYIRSETTVLPLPGFTGMLRVPVSVYDGSAGSAVYYLNIEVLDSGNGENAPPEKPAAIQPANGSTVDGDSVVLEASVFKDPENDAFEASFWIIERLAGTNPCAEETWFSENTDPESGNRFVFEYPEQGVQYSWKVGYKDSGSGRITWSDASIFSTGSMETESVWIPPGSHIADYVAVAFSHFPGQSIQAFDDSLVTGYDPAMIRILGYDTMTGEYVEYGEDETGFSWAIPGKAQWVLARNGIRLDVKGVPVKQDSPFEVPLEFNPVSGNGWNLIGTPFPYDYPTDSIDVLRYDENCSLIFGPVSFAQLNSENEMIEGEFRRWKDGMYLSDVVILKKNRGYWIRVKTSGMVLRFAPLKDQGSGSEKQAISRSSDSETQKEDPPPPAMELLYHEDETEVGPGGGCFILDSMDWTCEK